ncbi:glycosyltransferase family 4 protein [Elusimicrobiota bacterium]
MTRILLVAPSRSDPAHARVASSLAAEYRGLGHRVRVLPSAGVGSTAKKLRALLDGGKVDACHVQFFSRGFGYLRKTRFPPDIRLVLTHQGASTDLIEHPAVFRRLAARADHITAVSRAGLKELRKAFPGISRKSSVVPNGVSPAAPRSGRRGLRLERPFVLSVGRLAGYKGLDVMALAFERLVSDGHELDWVLCGPDQTRGRLARFLKALGIGSRVRATGAVSAGRAAAFMSDCLFFVQPSRHENCPMALLEAMGAGKPVIASSVGGIPELVEHRKSGLLVPPKSPRALWRAMRELAGDSHMREVLGYNARRRACELDWRVIASRYLELGLRSA